MFVEDTAKSGAESETRKFSDRYYLKPLAWESATLRRCSLALVGVCSGASATITTLGEMLRVERVVANGPVITIESLKVGEFAYIAETSDGRQINIPRWDTLCVPPRDDCDEQGTITPEKIVLAWPSYLPTSFAWTDPELVVAERYYIVMPREVEDID